MASGKVAKEETKRFLLPVLGRGADLRYKFAKECETDSVRFLKPVSRTKILNFAAENAKRHRPSSADQKSKAAEGVRDVFGKILAVAAHSNSAINLQHILSFPSLIYCSLLLIVMELVTKPKRLLSRKHSREDRHTYLLIKIFLLSKPV